MNNKKLKSKKYKSNHEVVKKKSDTKKLTIDRIDSSFIEHLPIPYLLIDSKGKIKKVNKSWLNFTGYKKGEVVGIQFRYLFSKRNLKKIERILHNSKKIEIEEGIEIELLKGDGKKITAKFKANNEYYKNGKIKKTHCVFYESTKKNEINEDIELRAKILDAANLAVIATDPFGLIMYWGKKAENLYGWKKNEVIGKKIVEITPSNISKKKAREILNKLKNGKLWEGDFKVRKKDNTEFLAHVINSPVIDANNKLVGIMGLSRDVTDERENEKKIKNLKTDLEAILDVNFDSVFLMKLDGTIIHCNETIAKRFGYTKQTLLGVNAYSLIPKETAEHRKKYADKVVKIKKPIRFIDVRNDRCIDNSVYPLLDKKGNVEKLAIFAADITDRVNALSKLQESESKYKALVETSPSSILIIKNGKYVFANPSGAKMLGYKTPEEIIGKSIFTSISKESISLIKKRARNIGKGISNGAITLKLEKPDDSVAYVETTSVPIDFRGEKAGLIIGVDITDQKLASKELKSERNKLKDISDSIPGAIFSFKRHNSGKYEIIYMSMNAEDLFEEKIKILSNASNMFMGLTESDKKEFVESIEKSTSEFTTWDHTFKFTTRRKKQKWIHGISIPSKGEDNSIIWNGVLIDITAQRKAELELRKSQSKINSIFKSAPIGIGMVSNRVFTEVNDRLIEMIGFNKEELIGNNSRMIYPSDLEYENVGKHKYSQIDQRGTGSVETKFKRKDGKIIDVLLSSTPLDTNDYSKGVVFTALDITGRIKALQAIKEKEERLSLAIEGAGVAYWDQNFITGKVYRSKEWAEMLGYNQNEINEDLNFWKSISHPDDLKLINKTAEEHESGKTPYFKVEQRIKNSQGKYQWILNWGKISERDENGNPLRASGIHIDISERKKVEEKLLIGEERYRSLLENTNDAIFCYEFKEPIPTDLEIEKQTKMMYESYLVECNDKTAELYGFKKSTEVLNKNFTELFNTKSGSNTDEFFKNFIKNDYITIDEINEELQPDNSIRYFLNNASGVILNGKLIRTWGTFRDITDTVLANKKLKETQQMLIEAEKISNIGSWNWNMITGEIHWSDGLYEIYGRSKEDGPPDTENYLEYVHPEDKEKLQIAVEGAMNGDRKYSVEYRLFKYNDGAERYLRANGEVYLNNESKPERLIGVVRDITERKVAEKEIQESENRYKLLFESAIEALVIHIDDKIVEVNETFLKLFNCSRDEVIGKSTLILAAEESMEIAKERIKTKPSEASEFLVKKLDGTKFPALVDAKNINYKGNEARLVAIRDLTELKKTEAKLEKINVILKDTSELAKVGGWEVNLKDMTTYFTEETFRIYGLPGPQPPTIEEGIKFYPEDSREIIQNAVTDAIEKHTPYDLEIPFINAKGKHIWVRTKGKVEVENGKAIRLRGSIQDISDRKIVELALKESENKYRTLVNSASDSIFFHDLNGRFIEVNQAACDMLGYAKEELLTMKPMDIDVEENFDNIPEIMNKILEEGISVFESKHKRKDGKVYPVEIISQVVNYKGEQVILAIARDISERKKAEAELINSELRYRTQFNQFPIPIFEFRKIDGEFILTNYNYAADDFSEGNMKKMIDKNASDIYNDNKTKHLYEALEICYSEKRTFTKEYSYKLRTTKKVKWIHATWVYIDPDTVLLHSEDITERKKAAEKIEESNIRYALATKTANMGVWDWDIERNFIEWDEGMFSLYNLSKSQFTNNFEEWLKVVHPDDINAAEELVNRCLKTGENFDTEFRITSFNNEIRFVKAFAHVYRNEKGKATRMIGLNWDITEQKIKENLIRDSEERFRGSFEDSKVAMVLTNSKGEFVQVNTSACQMWDYTKEELLKFNYLYISHPNDIEVSKKLVKELVDGKSSSAYMEKRYITKSGNEIWGLTNVSVINVRSSAEKFLLAQIIDITDRKRFEENIRIFSQAVDQSQVSIIISDKFGNIEYVNPKFTKVTGYGFAEVLGLNVSILKPDNFNETEDKKMWNAITTGKEWNGIIHSKKKNNELFWESANISPIKNRENQIIHLVFVKEDITEKVKNEEELEKYRHDLEGLVKERTEQLDAQYNFLRTLIDTIPNPIFVKNINGEYTEINKAFEDYYEVKKEDLIGKTISHISEADVQKQTQEIDEQLLVKSGSAVYETYHIKDDGERRSLMIYEGTFGLNKNQPEGVAGVVFDITEQKELSEKTKNALNKEKELNEMKTSFISTASHEFRTPLTSILASADLLEMFGKEWPDKKYQKFVNKIQKSVKEMTVLLDEVLTLSRADRGKLSLIPKNINLKKIILELIEQLNTQKKEGQSIKLIYNITEEKFILDEKLLKHILQNLISNSIKYSDEYKNILIETNFDSNELVFQIKDEGIGIPENEIPKLFEPFYRAENSMEYHGSGLGLSIVQKSVELFNGKIDIKSQLGIGTEVIIKIPIIHEKNSSN